MIEPDGLEPVKATTATSGCSTSRAPTSSPSRAGSWTTPVGTPAGDQRLDERQATAGVCSAGFRITGLPATRRGDGHAGRDGEREVPRGDHHRDALALVGERFASPGGDCTRSAAGVEPQHLAAVVLAEVDGLADVGVGLVPRLAASNTSRRRARRAAATHPRGARNRTRGPLGGGRAPPRPPPPRPRRRRIGLGRRRTLADVATTTRRARRVDRG